MNRILYLMFVFVGIYNFSFSQKGGVFGRDFSSETSENVELIRKRIINNEIGEKFDTIIKIKNEYVFRFQKTDNYYLYYTTEHGYLHYLCEKKDDLVRCLYENGNEVVFKLGKQNVIKWFQFSSNNIVIRFTLNWDGDSYKVHKCTGCPPDSDYEKEINSYLKMYRERIIFIGMESN